MRKEAGRALDIYNNNLKPYQSTFYDNPYHAGGPHYSAKLASLEYWDKLSRALYKWMSRAKTPVERAARENRYSRAVEFRDMVDDNLMYGNKPLDPKANIVNRIPAVRARHKEIAKPGVWGPTVRAVDAQKRQQVYDSAQRYNEKHNVKK